MPRLEMVPDTGTRRYDGVSARLRRAAPHLYLVADTGSRYRAKAVARPVRRQSGWLSLSVAAAAAAASLLVAANGYPQAAPGADLAPGAERMLTAGFGPSVDPFGGD